MNAITLHSEYQISSRLKHGVCWTERDKITFNCKLTRLTWGHQGQAART